MFTIGIFTTHFPYIVLVVFYAFFWVFGYNDAISVTRHADKFELTTVQSAAGISELTLFNVSDNKVASHSQNFYKGTSLVFSPLESLIHKGFYFIKHIGFTYCSNLFSRPPPSIF